MRARLWLAILTISVWSCSLISSQPPDQPQHLFLGEYDRQTHGRMTWFDHLVEFDPGTFHVRTSAEFRSNPPKKIAVLPFTDTGSGNYVLNKAPIAVRRADELADWRWTDSNRLRKILEGYLAEREFTTVNLVRIDAILAAHGIDDDAKLSLVPPQELGRWLGVDAVVYGEVTHYEVYYLYLVAGWHVKLKVSMVSTATGCPLVTASGSRYKMQVQVATALRDIALDSAVDLTDLRDVDLRRTEEEAAREIVWRIPYTARGGEKPTTTNASSVASGLGGASPTTQSAGRAGEKSQIESHPPARSIVSLRAASPAVGSKGPSEPTGAQTFASISSSGSAGGKTQTRENAGLRAAFESDPSKRQITAVQTTAGESRSGWPSESVAGSVTELSKPGVSPSKTPHDLDRATRSDAPPELLNLAAPTVSPSTVAACMRENEWSNDRVRPESAPPPERFFLPELRNLSHGRKTVLDRMIETDPETFPMHVSRRYYEIPPTTLAVLPFQYAGSGNLQVDKLIPVTFHEGPEREKWRWTVGNRVRRTFTAYLAQREFDIVPLPKIDAALKAHGITTYQQLMRVAPEQLGRWLHADAVVYGNVTRYEGYYAFLVGGWTVGLRIRMVSTADGQELLNAEGGRWAMVLQPALTVTDILIDSGLNLFESLRDIRITRAEEETCREIILRIPEVPRSTQSLQMIHANHQAKRQELAPFFAAVDRPADPGHDSSADKLHDAPSAN